MATPTPIKMIPSTPAVSNIGGITLTYEDGSKDGFNNLGSANDSLNLIRTFVVGNQVFENTTNYKINAQAGDDVITTASGDDIVYGGSGNDTITTGKGADQLFGGSGDDRLYAGQDDDQLDGGSGNDYLDGGSGNDHLYGGTGTDVLFGGANNDYLYGGDGNDTLNGGDGFDQFYGGNGTDTLTGGAGRDYFNITLTQGADVITDFNRAEDDIFLSNDIHYKLFDLNDLNFDYASVLYNTHVTSGTSGLTTSYGPMSTAPVLIFDAQTQMLSFDQDGLLGAGAAVDLVQLMGVTHLDGSEFAHYFAV
jgi:Ca2+-binding RTX toxin-like protein